MGGVGMLIFAIATGIWLGGFATGVILGFILGIKAVHWVAQEGRIVLVEHTGR